MISYEDARHLLLRTQFGATNETVEKFEEFDRSRAIKALLAQVGQPLVKPPPAWAGGVPLQKRGLKGLLTSRKMLQETRRERAFELKGWWIDEMLHGHGFRERIVLMWHNHFTTSFRKVRSPVVLFNQHQTFREYSFGSFRTFLAAMLRDPGLLFFLDNHQNLKNAPNENLSRELLELFTLGEGNYSERDIKEIARALTGRSIDRSTGEYLFRRRQFDDGKKTFLGRENMYDGHDVVDAIMDHPEMPKHIVRRVWREFISEPPSESDVHEIADRFVRSKFELSPLYSDVLSHRKFWQKKERAEMVKSPIELVVGTLKMFSIDFDKHRKLVQACRAMGQDPFDPPNVKGWSGGLDWINSSSLLRRRRIMQLSSRVARRQNGESEHPANLFLARAAVTRPETVYDAMLDPAYQLK